MSICAKNMKAKSLLPWDLNSQPSVKTYHERHRSSEEFKARQRVNSKKAYEKDKERIIARVRANQRRVQELEQLERLHELKEQGLITFEKMSIKDNHELLTNLEILGM